MLWCGEHDLFNLAKNVDLDPHYKSIFKLETKGAGDGLMVTPMHCAGSMDIHEPWNTCTHHWWIND